jgi:ATP-dependent Lon protease
MIKTNLPVILLKGIILLPNNDIRLEFSNDDSKNIIDVSELFHENKILVVSTLDATMIKPEIEKLPKIGVISTITHRMELPNGKTRVIITGEKRAQIHEYLNLNNSFEVLESIVSSIEEEKIESQEEQAITRKLYREVETCSKNLPNMSNSILAQIINLTNLSKMTDIIAPYLPIDNIKLNNYLQETKSTKRAKLILEDLYKEKELYEIDKKIDANVKKSIDDNQKEFILREKLKTIKQELGEENYKETEIEELKEKIEQLKAPNHIKERLVKEIKRYENLSPMSPETGVVKNYIEWLLELPWANETKDNEDLKSVRKSLDESHYGLEEVKKRIVEFLAVKQMTNNLRGPIICLVGPPGVGKTSLAFRVAKAMNREFVKMSVGGINDEAEIIGHRKTYIGSSPGRIISSMKKAGSINPVFLIDEIDKMTKDIKGDPASTLLDVFDPEQNKFFTDNYIEEEYDLSKVLFITTANYIDQIPEALRDRLEIVELRGYTEYEKLDICKTHLIKKIAEEHGLQEELILFDDDALLAIIRGYTKEAGVRELERKLATIIRKIVTNIVMNGSQLECIYISKDNLKEYLGNEKYHFIYKKEKGQIGVVNGLAYTSYGGDVLPIEVNYYKGKGDLVLTGSLGDVMKESAKIALSYIKSNYNKFKINYEKILENDIHIHVPEGAIPKDGPSAGVALTTAIISALTEKKVSTNIAMTGEITLRGNVLGIGGLKEKSMGASRNNIKKVIIPKDNESDIDEIPDEIKKNIEYIPVNNYEDIFKIIFKEKVE